MTHPHLGSAPCALAALRNALHPTSISVPQGSRSLARSHQDASSRKSARSSHCESQQKMHDPSGGPERRDLLQLEDPIRTAAQLDAFFALKSMYRYMYYSCRRPIDLAIYHPPTPSSCALACARRAQIQRRSDCHPPTLDCAFSPGWGI